MATRRSQPPCRAGGAHPGLASRLEISRLYGLAAGGRLIVPE